MKYTQKLIHNAYGYCDFEKKISAQLVLNVRTLNYQIAHRINSSYKCLILNQYCAADFQYQYWCKHNQICNLHIHIDLHMANIMSIPRHDSLTSWYSCISLSCSDFELQSLEISVSSFCESQSSSRVAASINSKSVSRL